MPFSISAFIRVNRVYFIWAAFMALLYLFRDMFGLVFITFIMCFIASSITHNLRRKYHWSRRSIVIGIYILFLVGVAAFLTLIPTRILSETINFTEQLPNSMNTLKSWVNTHTENNEMIAPLIAQIKNVLLPETAVVSAWNIVRGVLEKGLHYFGWFFLAMLFSFLIMLTCRIFPKACATCVLPGCPKPITKRPTVLFFLPKSSEKTSVPSLLSRR